MPALLIPVALLVPPRPRWRAFFLGIASFAALAALNLFHRELLPDFQARAQALGSGGPGDPSSYSFFTMLKPYLGDARGLDDRLHPGRFRLCDRLGQRRALADEWIEALA